jgi:hypothetical protein
VWSCNARLSVFKITSLLMDLVTFIVGKHLLIIGDEIQISTWQSVGYVALRVISSLEEELDLLK